MSTEQRKSWLPAAGEFDRQTCHIMAGCQFGNEYGARAATRCSYCGVGTGVGLWSLHSRSFHSSDLPKPAGSSGSSSHRLPEAWAVRPQRANSPRIICFGL